MIQHFTEACSQIVAAGNDVVIADYRADVFGNWLVEFRSPSRRTFRLVWDNKENWLLLEQKTESGDFSELWIGHDPNQASVSDALSHLPKP